ncbi:hypothetical protein KXD40_001164 [Peronospora effusa]|uniref:Uncharacterized protein n=1 Tax=Peronospora effusa TaxID=542832 RepID=A0A3M6VV59_9STRA|nr:hypothetical protein DD238_002228 [Peronospora effusa]RQM15162.1 hypothetical protein DD237_005849 [Peronospora effusa]UIZ20813.1 hypothetical protein KXD40_001164 [Peronospora effusa]
MAAIIRYYGVPSIPGNAMMGDTIEVAKNARLPQSRAYLGALNHADDAPSCFLCLSRREKLQRFLVKKEPCEAIARLD